MMLRGKVHAVSGAPVAKAEVTLSEAARGGWPVQYLTTTAADGSFQFDDFEPGQYFVAARRAGYVETRLEGPLTLAPDRDPGQVELQLTPQAVITGRVFDADGDPFEGVWVTLVQETDWGGETRLVPRSGPMQFTNDDGEFRIAGVAPGTYLLQAAVDMEGRRRPHRSIRQGPAVAYPDLYYPDVHDVQEAQSIDVAMGARLGGFELHMRPGRAYRVRGRVLWPAGVRPEFRQLHLHPIRTGRGGYVGVGAGSPPFAGETFDFAAVLPGKYMLMATCQSQRATVELTVADRDLDDIVLRFAEGFPVRGIVRGLRDGDELRFNLAGPAQAQGATGEGGAFTLVDVVPGAYQLHLWMPPERAYAKTVRYGGVEMRPDAIEIRGPATLEIELAFDSATVGGTLDPPRRGAFVQLWRGPTPVHFAQADQDGRFEIRGVAPGEYVATANSTMRAPHEALSNGATIHAGPDERVTVQLKAQ